MSLLKKIPIRYKGELHQVQLINFSVDINEVQQQVPSQLNVRNYNGRALISMVNVQLKKMHPVFLPEFTSFNYQHVAFRLLIDDSTYTRQVPQGIYFYNSFTNKPHIVWGGGLFTDYRLQYAQLKQSDKEFLLEQKGKYLKYSVNEQPASTPQWLKQDIGAIDRAYSILDNQVRVTQIQREKWPIRWLGCSHFETNFFETARFEGAFEVDEVIYYQWLPPRYALPAKELKLVK